MKVSLDERMNFQAAEEPLKTELPAMGDGVEFLKGLCDSLPTSCGASEGEANKCRRLQAQATNGLLGVDLMNKWNQLIAAGGGNGDGSKQRKNKNNRKPNTK